MGTEVAIGPALAGATSFKTLIKVLMSDRLLISYWSDSDSIEILGEFILAQQRTMVLDRGDLPNDVRGKERVDDRRVISGILHLLKSGASDALLPPNMDHPSTIVNR